MKRLEQKNLVKRRRDEKDERNLIVNVTQEGEKLKDKAVEIPEKMAGCVNINKKDIAELYRLLHELLKTFAE